MNDINTGDRRRVYIYCLSKNVSKFINWHFPTIQKTKKDAVFFFYLFKLMVYFTITYYLQVFSSSPSIHTQSHNQMTKVTQGSRWLWSATTSVTLATWVLFWDQLLLLTVTRSLSPKVGLIPWGEGDSLKTFCTRMLKVEFQTSLYLEKCDFVTHHYYNTKLLQKTPNSKMNPILQIGRIGSGTGTHL